MKPVRSLLRWALITQPLCCLYAILQAHSYAWELYSKVHPSYLEWSFRWPLMLSEIQALNPDLVCLQEVDKWEEVEEGMRELG